MDIEDIPEEDMGSHWGKRIGAIIIDIILVGILAYCVFWILGLFSLDLMWLFTLWAFIFGIILLLYSAGLEGAIGATVGKGIMGLEVVAINSEMTGGKGFARNISKIYWIILILDWLAGYGTAYDKRQKLIDTKINTIVIKALPTDIPGPRVPYIAPLPMKEEIEEDRSEWEIPEELLSGNCSLCHTPYKVLPPEDNRSWSGLWNSRCIWCNKLVFEDYKRRKQPNSWRSPRSESWRGPATAPPHWGTPPPSWRSSSPSWR